MSLYDKIIISVFLFAIIVWQALHQAHLFAQNKTISHFWKGVAYACSVALITILYISIYDWWFLLKVPILGVIERMALFDFTLNIARSKHLFYNGKDSTGSKIDQQENKLSIFWLRILKIMYVVLFVIIIIFIK